MDGRAHLVVEPAPYIGWPVAQPAADPGGTRPLAQVAPLVERADWHAEVGRDVLGRPGAFIVHRGPSSHALAASSRARRRRSRASAAEVWASSASPVVRQPMPAKAQDVTTTSVSWVASTSRSA